MNTAIKLITLAALAALTVPAHAQSVYVIAGTSTSGPTNYQFGTLNLQSGNFTSIAASASYRFIYGLGFGANGTLYALSDDGTASAPLLDEYVIDRTSGALTLAQAFAGNSIFGGTANSSGVFTGLTDPGNASDSKLFTVNLAAQTVQNGPQTLVQTDGLVVPDGTGNIYASDKGVLPGGTDGLDKITSSTTGAAQFVGDLGISTVYNGLLTGGNLYAFGQDTNGALGVYTVNTTSGAANFVAAVNMPTSSFVQASALAPSPEPSPAVAVVVGMLGVGALCVRARRKANA